MFWYSSLQQALPGQLNLANGLALLEAALARTDGDPLSQLDLVFDGRKRAGAVVREVDTGERIGAEVVVAVGCK